MAEAGQQTQPKTTALRVFISYSRRESVIVDSIAGALAARGFEVLIDRRNLPFGEQWRQELEALMRQCDAALWMVSPASVESTWCRWEVSELRSLSKRLIPVLVSPTALASLPDDIGQLQLLPRDGLFEFQRDLDDLVAALQTDNGWLRSHTLLSSRANQWTGLGRSRDLLLRGVELSDAERWLGNRPDTAPAPYREVIELIAASRTAAGGRRRVAFASVAVAALLGLGLAALAWQQKRAADESARIADVERLRAEEQAVAARREATISGAMADASQARLALQTDAVEATRLVLEARRKVQYIAGPHHDAVAAALAEVFSGAREIPFRWPHGAIFHKADSLVFVAPRPDGLREAPAGTLPGPLPPAAKRPVLFATTDLLYVLDEGRAVAAPIAAPDDHNLQPRDAAWLDSDRFVVASGVQLTPTALLNAGLSVYDRAGRLLKRLLADHPVPVTAVRILDVDGSSRPLILAGDAKGSLWLFTSLDVEPVKIDTGTGRAIARLEGRWRALVVVFGEARASSASSAQPALPSWRSELAKHLSGWNFEDIRAIGEMPGEAGLCAAWIDLELLVCRPDGAVQLWGGHPGSPGWRPQSTFRPHGRQTTAIAYQPEAKIIATASEEGEIRLWTESWQLLAEIVAAGVQPIQALAFDGNGRVLVAGGPRLPTRAFDIADLVDARSRDDGKEWRYSSIAKAVFAATGAYPRVDIEALRRLEETLDTEFSRPAPLATLDGTRVLARREGRLVIVDPARAESIAQLGPPISVEAMDIDPDGFVCIAGPPLGQDNAALGRLVIGLRASDGSELWRRTLTIEKIQGDFGLDAIRAVVAMGERRACIIAASGRIQQVEAEGLIIQVPLPSDREGTRQLPHELAVDRAGTRLYAVVRPLFNMRDSRLLGFDWPGLVPNGLSVDLGGAGRALAVSPDSERIAVQIVEEPAQKPIKARLISRSGMVIHDFPGADRPDARLAFSLDGQRLRAVGGSSLHDWTIGDAARVAALAQRREAMARASRAVELLARAARTSASERFALLDQAIAIAPDDPKPLFQRALARTRIAKDASEWSAILSDYDRAVALDPFDANLRLQRGRARASVGRFREAIDDFDVMLSLPSFPRTSHHPLEAMPGITGAMLSASRALVGAGHNEARMRRAEALVRMGNFDAAFVALTTMLGPDGQGTAHAHQLLAEEVARKGQTIQASLQSERAAEALAGNRAFSAMDEVAPRAKDPIWRKLRRADFLRSAAIYADAGGDRGRALALLTSASELAAAVRSQAGLLPSDQRWADMILGAARAAGVKTPGP